MKYNASIVVIINVINLMITTIVVLYFMTIINDLYNDSVYRQIFTRLIFVSLILLTN